MKKLMFVLSAVALVGMVQASTVDWKYTISGASSNDAYSSGYTAYLFDATTWTTLAAGTVSASDLASKSLDSSAIAYQTSQGRGANVTYVFSTSSAAGTVGATRPVSNDSWTGATHDFYVVLFDGTKFTADSITMNTRDASGTADTSGALPKTQAQLNGATWTTAGVPEPTSGILMLVGLGALALRRRRA